MTVTVADGPPLTVSVKLPGADPLPVSGMVAGDDGSELATLSVALRAPTAEGVNVTVTAHPWPGCNVVTEQGTVTAKSAAFAPEDAMPMPVTGADPEFSSVSERFAGAPTAIVPKASAPGVICSFATTAFPVSATVSGSVVALVERLNVPVRVPATVGVNVTCNTHDAPAASADPADGQFP